MKGCKIFFVCLIFFVLSICGKGQAAEQNACINADEIPCDDGECIKRVNWCDGFKECFDWSDEDYCSNSWFDKSCTEKHFKCAKDAKNKCVPLAAKCDGHNDCGDSSDEKDCEPITPEYEESTTTSTVSIATADPRRITPTPSIPTRATELSTYDYQKRFEESNKEPGITYLPPNYYGSHGNNNYSNNQNQNNYNNHGQIPGNIDNVGQPYPYPYDQNRHSYTTSGPHRQPYVTPNQRRPVPPTPTPQHQLRDEYDLYRRNPHAYIPRERHLVSPPRVVLYPPTAKPEYSSNLKIKHPELPPFHFSENYTEQFTYNYDDIIERAKEWILKQRDDSGSWGKDTPRALIALSLITNSFTTNVAENELMRKNLQTHLGIKILRNKTRTEEMSTTRLAMYINALLATCQDPRDFFDIDLVENLYGRKNYVKKDQSFVNPLVYLSLCLNNKADVRQDPTYLKYLSQPIFLNEVSKDIRILATTALACYLQQDEHNRTLRETLEETANNILAAQKSDGSFGNKYNTALATQALMSLNLTTPWNPKPMLDYIARHQLPDGSFGNMMATYYSILALSGRSLLHLRNTKCDPRATTTESSPRTGPKKRIFYTLKIGHPETNSMALHLSVPDEANFFDVMRIAGEENPHFKFEYKITNGKLGVYSISNIQNDAERGRFWNLYRLQNTDSTVNLDPRYRYTGDIRDLIPREGDEMVYWYLPMFY